MNLFTKSFQLFVAPATTMSVGDLAGVKFAYTPVHEESLHCSVGSLDTYCDEFGDQMIRAEVRYVPASGIPILKLRLRHPSGETGFDSINVPRRIVDMLLLDGYLATDQPNALLPIPALRETEGKGLESLFVRRGTVPMIVTYHQPEGRLFSVLKTQHFSRTDATQNIKLLIETLHLCEAALVWSWAYGLNPVLLGIKSKTFIASLSERLKPELMDVNMVDAESMLPEW